MKIYIKFFTLIFLKSLLYVVSILFSLIFILNLLTELEFFKEIEVSSGFPLFLSHITVVSLWFVIPIAAILEISILHFLIQSLIDFF